MKGKKKRVKRKLNVKRVIVFLLSVLILSFFIYKLVNVNISNIYIKGNNYLTDQYIIDISGLSNYPNSLSNISFNIEKKLKKDSFILDAKVKKRGLLNKVYIEIIENYPLYYYASLDKTVLYNGDMIDGNISNITLINKIPDTIYDKFISKFRDLEYSVLDRISEVRYNPNEVDSERFLILMNDENYVYVTLNRFLNLNKYVDIIKTFSGKKGVLHLDSGEYFEIR